MVAAVSDVSNPGPDSSSPSLRSTMSDPPVARRLRTLGVGHPRRMDGVNPRCAPLLRCRGIPARGVWCRADLPEIHASKGHVMILKALERDMGPYDSPHAAGLHRAFRCHGSWLGTASSGSGGHHREPSCRSVPYRTRGGGLCRCTRVHPWSCIHGYTIPVRLKTCPGVNPRSEEVGVDFV